MANFYTVKKTIGDVEYTAQFNGIAAMLEATDNTYIDGTETTSMVKMTKYLLENVIVSPKGLTADSFKNLKEYNEVIGFARRVMQGEEFREDENDGGTKKKSE
jgi:hypothetical protein